MKPECSLPCKLKHTNSPCRKQMNPVCSLPSYLFQIHFNIIVPPMLSSNKLSVIFSDQIFLYVSRLPSVFHLFYPSLPPRLHRRNNKGCFKKSFTLMFQMLLCGECYENVYTLSIVQHLKRGIVCTPSSVKVFITLTTQ
jgi:hypothetical protein